MASCIFLIGLMMFGFIITTIVLTFIFSVIMAFFAMF